LLIPALALFCSASSAEPTVVAAKKQDHAEYKDWLALSVSHRLDKKLVRIILGNEKAIAAARSGTTTPWPDGTILAKVGWKERVSPDWSEAVIPGEFASAEAMVKDSKKYPETGGWGFGHWEADKLVMNDKEKSAVCFACHLPMKAKDYVFTTPVLQ
jgi:hypothetical protein